ncbi:unnamed protein product, partial [Ectocarpus sp. 4 AP-2014]
KGPPGDGEGHGGRQGDRTGGTKGRGGRAESGQAAPNTGEGDQRFPPGAVAGQGASACDGRRFLLLKSEQDIGSPQTHPPIPEPKNSWRHGLL